MHAVKGNYIAWAFDAQALTGRHDTEWVRDLYLVPVPGIDEFERGARVVAAIRGCGKSALMRRRAARLATSRDNMLLRAVPPLVNELAGKRIRIGASDALALVSPNRWEALWLCTLLAHFAALAMRESESLLLSFKSTVSAATKQKSKGTTDQVDLSDEELVERVVASEVQKARKRAKKTENPSSSVSAAALLLSAWNGLATPHQEFLGPYLNDLIEKGLSGDVPQLEACIEFYADIFGRHSQYSKQYFALIDAVDEAFVGRTEQGDVDLRLLPFEQAGEVWVAAQKGLVFACNRIQQLASNSSIIASVRAEVIHQMLRADISHLGGAQSKLSGLAWTELIYSESHLKSVFDVNVSATAESNLAGSRASDSVERLFGFREVWHSTVFRTKEHVLDLILRHTFGTPRDLVYLVKKAIDAVPKEHRRADASEMLDALDLGAANVCLDWLESLVPQIYSQVIESLPNLCTNIFTIEEALSFEGEYGPPGFFKDLFRSGLVGVPVPTNQGWRQKFIHPRTKAADENDQRVSYYALHPALSALLTRIRRVDCPAVLREYFRLGSARLPDFSYSSRFVVGNNLECPSEITPPRLIVDLIEWTVTAISPTGETSVKHSLRDSFTVSDRSVASQSIRDAAKHTIVSIVLTTFARKKPTCIVTLNEITKSKDSLCRAGVDFEFLGSKDGPANLIDYLKDTGLGDNSTLRGLIKSLLEPLGLRVRVSTNRDELSLDWDNGVRAHEHWSPVTAQEVLLRVPDQRSKDLGGPLVHVS